MSGKRRTVWCQKKMKSIKAKKWKSRYGKKKEKIIKFNFLAPWSNKHATSFINHIWIDFFYVYEYILFTTFEVVKSSSKVNWSWVFANQGLRPTSTDFQVSWRIWLGVCQSGSPTNSHRSQTGNLCRCLPGWVGRLSRQRLADAIFANPLKVFKLILRHLHLYLFQVFEDKEHKVLKAKNWKKV